MTKYKDFPKKGVVFQDMFSLLTNSADLNLFYNRLQDVCACCIYETGRPNDYFVAGIESRGLFLGGIAASQLRLPFLPLRKKSKLPRDSDHPIVSTDYDTEYSSDTIELQLQHLNVGKKCILIDDLVATGGSLCACIRLLNECEIDVPYVVVMRDVEALRPTWRSKLKQESPETKVLFLF